MIIVDRAFAERHEAGRPLLVGIVGAGFMGRGFANQIVRSTPGMRLAAIANRHAEDGVRAYREAGLDDVAVVDDAGALDAAVGAGRPVVTESAAALCRSERVECVVEVTGAVEHAARAVLDAIATGKHVVVMSAELDGTVGPLLRVRADEAGVVYTASDGDQPGVEMNLYRFLRPLGLRPLLCGTARGSRTPTATRRPRRASRAAGGSTPGWSRASPTARRSPSSRRRSRTPPG